MWLFLYIYLYMSIMVVNLYSDLILLYLLLWTFYIYIMKLDINEVYHKYIIRVVIFALFTFKGQLRQPNVYKQSIDSFVKKRIPWKINLYVDTGERLSKEEERDLLLDELLNGIKTDYLKCVRIIFDTPAKKNYAMEIDLSDEKKYEDFLYS